jgi:hyperosmotically inducible periplasmic protein
MYTTKNRKLRAALVTGLLCVTAIAPLFAQAPPQRQAAAQAKLEKEVRHVLVMLPYYSVFDNLAYGVDGDRVTLNGQVVRPTTKTDAEKSVKSIEGVAVVDNQIEVLPTSPGDDRIRRAEFRAIYSASNLQRYAIQAVPPIHIIVKNGNVTLTGAVANQADKTIAEMKANSVPGVFSVKNELITDK